MSARSYERALLQLAEERQELIVMTAENRAPIRGLARPLGPRFVDVGICEQTLVGAAAGLALRGRRPVLHALAAFLTMRAFEFIRSDVGIGRLPVTLVGFVPGFLSEANGPTHQALEDVALMRGVPGMQVFCPADEDELADALPAILDSGAPAYVRYPAPEPSLPHRTPFAVGRAERIHDGRDVTLLSYGPMLLQAEAARRLLEAEGVSVRLVDLRSLQPADEPEILAAADETRLLVTLEDHFESGGLYSIVAETLLRGERLRRVLPLALRARFFRPALLDDVIAHEGFDGPSIAARVRETLQRPSPGR
jgi:transketolase